MQSKLLTYKSELVGYVLHSSDKVQFKPIRGLSMGRSPIWFWLRKKISEFGFSYKYETGGIITLYLYQDEHLNLRDVEGCVAWAYARLLRA